MAEVLFSIKAEIIRRGKKIKHLATDLSMDYNKLGRILNGFDHPPSGFNNRVNAVFEMWDNEKELYLTNHRCNK